MQTSKAFELAGLAMFVLGALLLINGTTSQGIFIAFGALALAGVATASYGRSLRDRR